MQEGGGAALRAGLRRVPDLISRPRSQVSLTASSNLEGLAHVQEVAVWMGPA